MLKYFLLALLPLLSLHANDNPGLFFTGPLLAPDGNTVAPGHLNWEPYLFVTTKTGEYDSNWKSQNTPNMIRIQPQLSLTIGLSKRFDIEITPQLIHNRQQGEHSTNVGDLPVSLGFQALHDEKRGFMPDLRITLDERFPLGKYQKLDPSKLGTDRTGTGSFITGLGFNFQKLFYLKNNKFLRARLTTSYLVPAPVHVKGFNTYGGGFGTTGKVFPGHIWESILAFEYTLTQHWVPAIDIQFVSQNKTRFSGKRGTNAKGTPAKVGGGDSKHLSLAPAMEYNFNASVGIIAGVWFTVVGRNSPDFISAVMALNIYH